MGLYKMHTTNIRIWIRNGTKEIWVLDKGLEILALLYNYTCIDIRISASVPFW